MANAGEQFRSSNRLKRPEDFKQVFSSKLRSGDKSFLFVARKNNTQVARLGLAVPKKNIRLSVERNRIKRQIRESFRLVKERLQGIDVVVVVKEKIKTRPDKLEAILNKHWNKISK